MTNEQKADECWSMDESEFRYGCLGDLIDSCRDELAPGSTVYVGESVPANYEALYDADDLIESLGERAYDAHGEWAEDWPDVTKEAKREFDAFLKGWIERYCKPNFYSVKNVRPYTLTAEDLQE